MMRIIYGDICQADCEAVVSASNGIGYMGGKKGIKKRLSGVAESIHYVSNGKIEQAAKKLCRENSIFGYAPGSVYVTPAYEMQCNYIIHAVTMRFPGSMSNTKTIRILLPKIMEEVRKLGIKSVAIPLLGTGTGHVSEQKVLALYSEVFEQFGDIDICVYIYRK